MKAYGDFPSANLPQEPERLVRVAPSQRVQASSNGGDVLYDDVFYDNDLGAEWIGNIDFSKDKIRRRLKSV
jgi:hypothetical protein